MEFNQLLKIARKNANKTLEEVANDCGVSKATVQRWESGEIKNVRRDKISKLSASLNVSASYLMGWDEDDGQSIENTIDNIYKVDKIKLPLLGSVACGQPVYADENRESYIMVGTEIKADFCLQCKGDSMINARIHDGDIVFVKKQSIVNNGEIAVVIIDDEATLKRFYYYKEQDMLILKPENSKYEDIILTGEKLNTVRVIGKAIAFQSDVI